MSGVLNDGRRFRILNTDRLEDEAHRHGRLRQDSKGQAQEGNDRSRRHIVETKHGEFEPANFDDRDETAVAKQPARRAAQLKKAS